MVTDWKLEQLSARLLELLKDEPDPKATMQRLARRLRDADMTQYEPKETDDPQTFVMTLLEDNPQIWDEVAEMPLPNLAAIETADELIGYLMPNNYDHG